MRNNKICPECKGEKIFIGHCECDSEWRNVDGQDDCICEPDRKCPTCNGKGVVNG